MRLLADECVNSSTVTILRTSVPDTVHLSDLGLSAISNGEVIDLCVREDRVLFTLNYKHFSDRKTYPIGANPGIIVVRVTRTDWNVVDPIVREFLTRVSLHDLERRLTVIRRTDFRIFVENGSVITGSL